MTSLRPMTGNVSRVHRISRVLCRQDKHLPPAIDSDKPTPPGIPCLEILLRLQSPELVVSSNTVEPHSPDVERRGLCGDGPS
ncbi:hypothetical protein BDW66DRAFT_144116 [Aspergillus desertorum]